MISTVAVGTDGSATATEAVKVAAEIAGALTRSWCWSALSRIPGAN